VALCPVVTRARVLVHEVFWAEEFAEQQRAQSSDHAGLEVEEHRTGQVFAARGLVVKHVDAAHEIARAEGLAERRRAKSANHAGLEVEENRAGTYLPPEASWRSTLMQSCCASLSPQYSSSPPMRRSCSSHTTSQNLVPCWLLHWPGCACARSCAKEKPGGVEHAEEKERGGGGVRGKCNKLRVAVWHGKQKTPVARASESRTGKSNSDSN